MKIFTHAYRCTYQAKNAFDPQGGLIEYCCNLENVFYTPIMPAIIWMDKR